MTNPINQSAEDVYPRGIKRNQANKQWKQMVRKTKYFAFFSLSLVASVLAAWRWLDL